MGVLSVVTENPVHFFSSIGYVVAAVWLLKTVYRLKRFFKGHFTGPAVNFRDLGEYAVITGATDGIGKAYAFELARYGMNIVLVSRTLSRLEETAEELKKKYPQTKVKLIVANYENTDIYEHLERELADVDVGVLVNNVGAAITPAKLVSDMPREDAFRMIHLNITSVVLTSHVVLPKMVAKKKGAVINISSMSALFPPVYCLYASAKNFIRRFSYGLRLQYAPLGIIIQDVEPAFVTTKLAGNLKGFGIVDPETCATQSLKTVGHYDETNGAIVHEIQGYIYSLLPDSFLIWSMKSIVTKAKARLAAEAAEAAKKK